MAAKVIWSVRAQRERFEILEYWVNRNKSKTYSRKLYQLFRTGMKKVAEMPEAGIPTENPDVRIKIIRITLFIITSVLLKQLKFLPFGIAAEILKNSNYRITLSKLPIFKIYSSWNLPAFGK